MEQPTTAPITGHLNNVEQKSVPLYKQHLVSTKMRYCSSIDYNPSPKEPSRRDKHRQEVRERLSK
jgi:hypothetical protein